MSSSATRSDPTGGDPTVDDTPGNRSDPRPTGADTAAPTAPTEPPAGRATATAPAGARTGGAAEAATAPAAERGPDRPAGRGRRLLGAVPRHLAAAVCGLALALSFPPYDLWPLSFFALAGLSLLTRGVRARHAALLGLSFAAPFFLLLLSWLRTSVGPDAWIALSLIQALFLVALGAGLAAVSRLPGWPLWTACLWVAQEWARDRIPFGGFPWGRLAFAHTDTPFTPLAALGGAPLVTFAVALTAALLAAATAALVAAAGRRPDAPAPAGRGWPRVAGPLLLAAAVLCAGLLVPVPTGAGNETVRVAVVQGNVPRLGLDFLGQRRAVLDNHVEATMALAEDVEAGRVERPDVVIWPENASDLNPFTQPDAYALIDQAVRAVGVPVLIGTLVAGPDEDHVQNQGIVWDPVTGPGASYTKQHPVPFGEYVPFREELTPLISRLERIPRDFWHGSANGVLELGPATIGDVICFEVAYDEVVRDTVDDGAEMIVVQTNNATFGRTGQPEQQLAMSRLRAVEHGRAVAIAATSGISAFIAPDGTVEQRTEEFVQQVMVADVPQRDSATLATRVGAAPEWTLAILGLLAWAGGAWSGRRAARAAAQTRSGPGTSGERAAI
ncbi:apolipoprotein N-acyltransferase [Allostreptomyces psammosilenae]|uniref:Apolipoprotein N-acyltransferase n=1 Tax=Allostreptomyces psammosilenae TaxID=1892865 RepID=A0A852ZS29_9ACTN|nr:apolipoprotein N-acyltransferase [Allostreptomyces psammosilenae]NYI04267.1 apolipoprotein N-acyltransferase [Allostreptomyces psammosilenae]